MTRPEKSSKWLPPRQAEQMYTVTEVAEILSVSRHTVFKWLSLDEAIIRPDDWLRLPGSGHIRIFERAILKLQTKR